MPYDIPQDARLRAKPQPMIPTGDDAVATAVVHVLEQYSNCLDGPRSAEQEARRWRRVREFVRQRQPVQMVILGFPAKSPNRRKTLSDHVDLGEVEGLRTLHEICQSISRVHRPGGVVQICSDGHVFADLVHVTDQNVDCFQTEIESVIVRFGFSTLRTFSARAAYPALEGDALRRQLVADHAKDLAATRAECLETAEGRSQWGGIHRFLFEDDLVLFPELSRNQIRERSKQRAYEVIQRSQSFSSLVQEWFPHAVRLSIHPHLPASAKLGICLVPSEDRWATPWHNALVMTAFGARLMHRAEAEQRGARLCHRDEQFAFFDLRP
ncbi:MAG: L-tyrosine/L-tryptophan isonitrile synthase family protein [Planctomycetota bacterium]